MISNGLLQGQVALVTGAGRGIGAGIAFALAEAGAKVIVSDRSFGDGEDTTDRIRDAGGKAASCILDVTDRESCAARAAEIESEFGPVSILVNNAGVTSRGQLDDDCLDDDFQRTFDVNVMGMMNVTRAFRPQLAATKGAVINLSSIVATIAGRSTLPYSASKSAVAQLTRSLARVLGPEGIRVNAVAPGFIETPMTADLILDSDRVAQITERTMLKRIGQPADIAGPIVFLSSHLASYVTAQLLTIDGGYALG